LTLGINPRLKRAIDQDLYYKLEEVGGFLFIDIPLYYYRIHKASISSLGKNKRKAMFWHLKVQEDAYLRRKGKRLSIPLQVLKDRWKTYYLSLMEEAKSEKNKKKYFYAFREFCMINPFSELNLKLSLIKQFLTDF
jgi:hypothetical protein